MHWTARVEWWWHDFTWKAHQRRTSRPKYGLYGVAVYYAQFSFSLFGMSHCGIQSCGKLCARPACTRMPHTCDCGGMFLIACFICSSACTCNFVGVAGNRRLNKLVEQRLPHIEHTSIRIKCDLDFLKIPLARKSSTTIPRRRRCVF